MSVSLDGKAAIVTGAGQGVGEGIALELAASGAAVVVAGRTASKVERTASTIRDAGGTSVAVRCDVGVADDVEACVQRCVEEFGTVDVLVNNAQSMPARPAGLDHGGRPRPRLAQRTAGRLPLHAGVPPVPARRRLCRQHRFGHGDPARPERLRRLCGCKEALRTLSRAAACEWGRDGVRVNVVLPLALSPNMQMFLQMQPEALEPGGALGSIPLGFVGDCRRDIGPAVAWLCSDDASYVTGACLTVDGGQDYVR